MAPKKKRAASPTSQAPAPKVQRKKGKAELAAEQADPSAAVESSNKLADVNDSKRLNIPVDELCPLANYRVWIDHDDGVIYDASLNQTAAGKNANKFYRIQVPQHIIRPPASD